jgi:glycosyltransferase involved in cell wall biosynthesis
MARSVYYFTDSRQNGGAEAALLLLIDQLDHSAWRPTLLHTPSAALLPVAEAARGLGAQTMTVEPHRVDALVRELRRGRPDVFHAHLSWPLAARPALAAAIAARVPAVVATFHLFPPGPLGRTAALQGRLLSRGVGRAIAVSDGVAQSLVRVLRWPEKRIEVIRNGVVLERFRRERGARSTGEFVFLTVARLDRQKGIDVLLRAAALVAGVRFSIAGAGEERETLERQADALGVGDRVTFLGRRDDVPALLGASDAFVLPSRFEGTPLALLEAMAAGKPIVASAIPGIDEVVADGATALLAPPDDPEALARALRRIVAEPQLRDSLAAAARARAEREFSAARGTQRVTAVYEDLL